MSQLDFSEGEHLDAMSSISTTWTGSIGTASPPLNPSASLHNSTEGKKHPTFYFSDFINVQVEHMVYRFPSALIDSSNLKGKVKGLRSNECLSLEGIPHHEVQAFLDVADARLVSGDKHFTFPQWASALSAADHLQVAEISTYVAKSIEDGLSRLDPFDCIQAAEIYRAQDWLLQPFRRICERRDPLSPSEMLLLGLDRAGAIARARENLMRTIYSKGLFDALYGSSELSSSAQTTLASHALEAVKRETLLCQLASEQQLTRGARNDHQAIYPNHLTSSDLTVQDSLYRLPLHYFGDQSLIHKLDASKTYQGPVILPNDTSRSEWEIFLQIITARPYDQSEPSLTFSEWMSGLRLAKKLDHGYAPRYIFGRIQKDYPSQDPVDLLEAARLAEAPASSWLQDRYVILSRRITSISSEEMRRIGEDASAEVCRMREQEAYEKGKREPKANSGRGIVRRRAMDYDDFD